MADLYNQVKYALLNQIKTHLTDINKTTTVEDFSDDTYAFTMTQGANPWIRDNGPAPNGNTGFIRSATITDTQKSEISFSYTVPAGIASAILEIDWMVDSEASFDYLRILVDNVLVFSASGSEQGTFLHNTTTGTHTVLFRYEKDGAVFSGADMAYISALRLVTDLGGEEADVYPVYFQNIAMFPAIAIQTERRVKRKKGVGKISEIELLFNVWTYVKIADFEDAEAECMRLTEIVEQAIEKDKTLGGIAMYLTIDDELDFGVVETNDGIFLQGSKILLTVKKRVQG